MKQTKEIREQCQGRVKRGPSKGRCVSDATIGVYTWAGSETDVNLNRPVALFCGEHKPRLQLGQLARNVKIARRLA